MSMKRLSKGKRKASYNHDRIDSPDSQTSARVPVKKPKCAETRPCPVCQEPIPLRLMGTHAQLESERVDMILRSVGSLEVHIEAELETPGAGPSAPRRSAVKARQVMSNRSALAVSLQQTDKTINAIKRNRKTRHAKLREMTREDEELLTLYRAGRDIGGGQGVCPVCSAVVRGDTDVIEAHVDSCLAYEAKLIEERKRLEQEQQALEVDVDGWDEGEDAEGEGRIHIAGPNGLRGMGFHVRERTQQDVEEDIDVEGDEDMLFGDVQFTESDVVAGNGPVVLLEEVASTGDQEIEDSGEDDAEGKSLRELVALGKVVKRGPAEGSLAVATKPSVEDAAELGDLDRAEMVLLSARRTGNPRDLVVALEGKVKLLESMRVLSSTAPTCRICLDPYRDPTVSTGCWHTCCRECWLRCLGSTKLCPMCKRITAATELRRVYL
ncbi:hypothetical protein PUNSTDRAFT_142505 [Punctularia strigosozonata HHB-11173 SS5]|uniref:uncharacterized protein n=1 Tax=Punctularia strigosozonata (strain HHB-11173) TaxID=741275 RepID=UPI0004416F92|nr:uncharacterized protein PUNSTDRAFT_142505 [Punctularia strigosozonata HHB-11173 SS5]EIN10507.1 hypothetical protein PUNSTDRAFT_142505 [Punctularia strigosozonata HHB-11173 SS5]